MALESTLLIGDTKREEVESAFDVCDRAFELVPDGC